LTKQLSYIICICALFLFSGIKAQAQTIRDSSGNIVDVTAIKDKRVDSILLHHSPRKAAIRSAILPGWGQAYNKRYWKIPIVYAALGTSAYVFVDNVKWYRSLRYAYKVAYTRDTGNFQHVHVKLQRYVETGNTSFLQYQRNEFRRNIDYSVLVFILLWGLNVVDATVDAHLKSFDVSPDLSFKIKPGYSEMGGTHGVSLVLAIK